jgi:hypothetical protein
MIIIYHFNILYTKKRSMCACVCVRSEERFKYNKKYIKHCSHNSFGREKSLKTKNNIAVAYIT